MCVFMRARFANANSGCSKKGGASIINDTLSRLALSSYGAHSQVIFG